ncbi:MAG: hypothetical protein PHG66_02920 [Candidatus Colwellbacteria bacterium]|nr:hypothetical protein [Candidatus Colwellbacteria bacterium]
MGHKLAITDRIETPIGLENKIIERISIEKRRAIKIKMAFFGSLAIGSAALCVPLAINTAGAFASSGFFQYFSLLFSDSAVIFSSLSDFGSVLLESLPMMEIIAILATASVLLWSAVLTFSNIGTMRDIRRIRTIKAK